MQALFEAGGLFGVVGFALALQSARPYFYVGLQRQRGVNEIMKKVVIAISILFVLLAIGGYFGKRKYDSMLNAASEGLSYGNSFGKMVNQSKCLLGLKAKYFSCNTVECELSANGYISGCLNTAEKDEFCKAVPNIKDTDQALSWVSKTCTQYNLGTVKCLKYMHKFVSVCTEQTEGKALSNKELFESGFKKGLKTGQPQ